MNAMVSPPPPLETPPWDENERLAALDRCRILDTPTERDFDEIVRLAAETFGAPIAVANLIAAGRQCSRPKSASARASFPSTCRSARMRSSRETIVVPDTRLDERFACNPLVTAADGLRFYAGALLKTEEGLPLGTVCILDREPRPAGITDHSASLWRSSRGS